MSWLWYHLLSCSPTGGQAVVEVEIGPNLDFDYKVVSEPEGYCTKGEEG